MSIVTNKTLAATGTTRVNLSNHRGERNIYTVFLSGTFGGTTATIFTNGLGNGLTANDCPLDDATGTPLSITANTSFNFEANSAIDAITELVVTLTGGTGISLNLLVKDTR